MRVEGAPSAGSMIGGSWECMEMSHVGMSRLNVSVRGEGEETVTILVRGGKIAMEQCDMRY